MKRPETAVVFVYPFLDGSGDIAPTDEEFPQTYGKRAAAEEELSPLRATAPFLQIKAISLITDVSQMC